MAEENVLDLYEEYAEKILNLARDTITVRYRFFDAALNKLKLKSMPGTLVYETNGEYLYYDPVKLLNEYKDEPNIATRLLLHVLFHGIFLHSFRFDKTNENYWNLATDIAVENIILDMDIQAAHMTKDDEERTIISKLKKWVPKITAEKLYREFAVGGLSQDSEILYKKLFTMDRHRKRVNIKEEPDMIITEEDWKKILERVKAELESFSKAGSAPESLKENLGESTRKRYNFDDMLRKFSVQGEEITVNPDEFDYIYYTYGLSKYGNLPLIEPLEYAEIKRVKEFVIVLDTSASCRGEVVKNFLKKTYDILTEESSFFNKVNVHIVECDREVQEDIKITSLEEFKRLTSEIKLTGFGATDFRPAFNYVDDLIKNKEFENLKGLIYFTDGFGIYPEKAPDYDVIFAFLGESEHRPPVPTWAIKAILEEESYEH